MYAKIAVNKNEYSREEKKKLNFKKKKKRGRSFRSTIT